MEQENEINRREFISTGVGYALAVTPIAAWAINTPTKGLTDGAISIPVNDGTMPGYWAMPKSGGPFPCVIVVQEIFGIHEYIKDVCRRLAKMGYVAIAPALYFRQGDPTQIQEIDQIISQIVSKVPQAQVLSDLDSTVAFLKTQKKANSEKIGITGFCWGGNATWMYSWHNPSLKAGVAWYGRVTGEKSENQPKFPLEIAAELKVPVLGLYGGKDTGIPLEQVEKMKAELTKGKSKSTIVIFPEAQHGFHADYRPSYNKFAAENGWKRLNDWFHRHGLK